MYERVIKDLLSTVRNKRELAGDITGVLTKYTKDEAARDVVEFEQAIAVLRNCGTQAASDNTASASCEQCKHSNEAGDMWPCEDCCHCGNDHFTQRT